MTLARGQTLIELIAAIAVLGFGLFTVMMFAISNTQGVQRSTDEVASLNLAREEIEFAKNLRDSNWMAGNVPFDTGMYSGTDYSATPLWGGSGAASFDFTADDYAHAQSVVVSSTSGYYANAHTAGPAITGMATPYSRYVVFHPICDDHSVLNSGSACISPLYKIGVRVEARVRVSRQSIKEVVMYEDLYDWR